MNSHHFPFNIQGNGRKVRLIPIGLIITGRDRLIFVRHPDVFMKRQNLKLGFRNASAQKQLEICDTVLGRLDQLTETGRAGMDLPGLKVTVATAHASRQRIQQLRADLKHAVAVHKLDLRAAREGLTCAHWAVTSNLHNNPAALLATGLPEKMPWQKVGVPAAPWNVTARATEFAGEIQLRWQRTVRRCLFTVEFTTNPLLEKSWRMVGGNRSQTFIVPELKSGTLYWFRIRAVNIHGASSWSEVASARAS